MKKIIIAVVALVLIAAGGWLYGSPYLAVDGLRTAIQQGDEAELEKRVDFAAIRKSMKAQMMTRMEAEAAQKGNSEQAKAGLAMAKSMIEPIIDQAITAEGMANMSKAAAAQGDGDENQAFKDFQIKRTGLTEFRLFDPKDNKAPEMVFHMNGAGWKMVDMQVPEPPAPGAE